MLMMDSNYLQQILTNWATGLDFNSQIVNVFEKVRDIPYGYTSSRGPNDVYRQNKGTCSGKHALLKALYQKIGIGTKDFIALHRFKDLKVNYPPEITAILDRSDIIDPHNFIKIFVDNKWITVDATWDKPLKKIGFVVNENWDGKTEMQLCVLPIRIYETKNPVQDKKGELSKLTKEVQEERILFLRKLSDWLTSVR